MARIVKESHVERFEEFHAEFRYLSDRESGYSFSCGRDGNVDESTLQSAALENYRACRSGVINGKAIQFARVQCYRSSYRNPAILQCDCGRQVELHGFTNECDCGADYNHGGQRLAPRSQWGDETGETAADIVMGGEVW